ncbi:MAG: hypothetical protein ABSH19_09915 [Opitutales bacterium]
MSSARASVAWRASCRPVAKRNWKRCQRLSTTFGQPHLHSGLGVRRLRADYFECRLDRDLRMIFKLDGGTLLFALLGNHDDVRRFIQNV